MVEIGWCKVVIPEERKGVQHREAESLRQLRVVPLIEVQDFRVIEEHGDIVRKRLNQAREPAELDRNAEERRMIGRENGLQDRLMCVHMQADIQVLFGEQQGALQVHVDLVLWVEGPLQESSSIGFVQHRAGDIKALKEGHDALREIPVRYRGSRRK